MAFCSTPALAVAALLVGSAPASAQEPPSASSRASVEPSAREAAGVVDAFHAALTAGKVAEALGLLRENAVIFESGGVERGKAEYASLFAAADAAFAQAVPSRVVRRADHSSGDTAWILTEGRTTGRFGQKFIDRATTETMLLRRVGDVWRIIHIHWSSGAAPPVPQ